MVASLQNISLKTSFYLVVGIAILMLSAYSLLDILGIIGASLIGVGGILFFYLQRVPGSFIILYLISIIFVLDSHDGIQLIELPFFGLSLLLLLYVGMLFITGAIILENYLDYLFLFLYLLIPYAVVLGKLNGADTYKALGEVVYFIGVFLYFPLRKYFQIASFKKIFAGLVVVITMYVIIRNFYYYQQIILQALLPYQAENARVAANEIIVVLGCTLAISSFIYTKSKIWQLVFLGLFLISIVALVLTQSRGYWIAAFMSFVAIFFIVNKKRKIKLITAAVLSSSILTIVLMLLFSDLFSTIINGLLDRLQSLGATSKDNSLNDRWTESVTVFNHIIKNPIAGYGLGFEFNRKVIFFDYYKKMSFVHNAYLGAVFKLGIFGLFAFLSIWLLTIKNGIILLKKTNNKALKIFLLTSSSLVVGMLFVNMTSSQILTLEGNLITTSIAAFINTRLCNSTPKSSVSNG